MEDEKMIIETAKKAIENLNKAKKHLDTASIWSGIDIFGGGIISGMVKRDGMKMGETYIKEAEENIKYIKEHLQENPCENINLEVWDIHGTLDLLFDNIFSDFIIHNRINEAKEKINSAIETLEDIVKNLEENITE